MSDIQSHYRIAIIGGGIVGLATARAIVNRWHLPIVVLEAERAIATHQTGNNSGVIHAGLYYKPGSLKAKNCVEGREALYRYCAERAIPHERCGKVVVATTADEIPRLDELERRGRDNGLIGLKRLSQGELKEREPHARGVAALLAPETGIIDYVQVARAYAEDIAAAGGDVRTSARVTGIYRRAGELVIETTAGETRCDYLINCGGLQCDRIARLCGVDPGLAIIPFRGEYYEIVPERRHLVKHLIYPVPDPAFPFLGVHFTRMINGGVEAGPNAVLALRREGYEKLSFSARDALGIASWGGFWRMARKHWRMSLGEFHRSFSKPAFARALQALVPEIGEADLIPGGAGVRAQAVERDGKLVDDFRIIETDRQIHVLNAPSPAATASLAIGAALADRAAAHFRLDENATVSIVAEALPEAAVADLAPPPDHASAAESSGE